MSMFKASEDLDASSAAHNDPCDELLNEVKLIRNACNYDEGWVSKWEDYSEFKPPFDKLRDGDVADFIPFYVELLDLCYGLPFVASAASALATIASRSSWHAECIIDNGALRLLVNALSCDYDFVVIEAAEALGDIADASPSCRDKVLEEGALESLLSVLKKDSKSLDSEFYDPWRPLALSSAMVALSNLCRSMPSPTFDKVEAAVPVVEMLIWSSNDEIVLGSACWTLNYLADGHRDKMRTVIDKRTIPALVECLKNPSDNVVAPALKVLGHVADDDAKVLIDNNIVPSLYDLLTPNHGDDIKEDARRILSNIASTNSAQVHVGIWN